MDQDINSNEHARQRRELLDLIIRLQSIGLGSELELPQIACIGSQSVGKSSLIESISGVALPRASGTCTRCPIECRLKRSEQAWEATVYLRFESGKSGYTGKTKEVQFGAFSNE
ncbi:Interferon-induced GTP-binding protein Mx AltName: Full=Interferon-inducible Mx protein [Rhizoctonia solani AG-1 IB]|uniref:Mx protein n=2 Tax=Rhizoctonia solani TaxID=456999 RepID=M5BYV4_THACB|nr:Interferon-induced GTP-binding protein Mx AltName: Full=Interferon-inducible Mx protein [Rhizoctonia solani AG-1 IB]